MMRPSPVLATLVVGCLLMIGCVNLMPAAVADSTSSEKVPAPTISVTHVYNQTETYKGQAQSNFDNEAWGISIADGDLTTLISARNYSNSNSAFVDYNVYFNFYLDGKFYIAMFTIDQVLIKIANDSLVVPLKNCAGFDVSCSPVTYDDTIPTIECNVTYRDIRVFSDNPASAFDLTLLSHFRGDWNQSSIKVDALLDLRDTDLGQYAAGTSFTAEIHYIMQLTDPSIDLGPPDFNTIKPSRYTDTILEYNLTDDNGSPYSLSKLDMNDNFTIYNATGAHVATGSSRIDSPNETGTGMQYNHNARVVTHVFSNLTYKDTISIRSDPEIIVFHDRNGNASGLPIYVIPIAVVASVLVVTGAFLVMRKKRNSRGQEKEGRD